MMTITVTPEVRFNFHSFQGSDTIASTNGLVQISAPDVSDLGASEITIDQDVFGAIFDEIKGELINSDDPVLMAELDENIVELIRGGFYDAEISTLAREMVGALAYQVSMSDDDADHSDLYFWFSVNVLRLF